MDQRRFKTALAIARFFVSNFYLPKPNKIIENLAYFVSEKV
ncbi:MAG: hypothetical protein ACJAWA_002074 [Nonlabens sp.]|jgi:hypothetical protein